MGFRPTEKIDCVAVVQSEAGTFLGVSNIVWGFVFYFLVTLLSVLWIVAPPGVAEWVRIALGVLVGWGFLYTAYLVWYQHHVLRKYCPLCLASAFTVLSLTVVMGLTFLTDISLSIPPVVVIIATLLFVAGVLIQVFPRRMEESEEHVCGYEGELPGWRELLEPDDPRLGPPDSPVVVVEFFDPNCPHCRALHPQLMLVLDQFADQVIFSFKPVALWEYSVPQIEALYLAYQQGRFFDMLEAQYAHARSRGLSMEELVELARKVGMDTEAFRKGLEKGLYRKKVQESRKRAMALGVRSVPTLLINGHVVRHTSESMQAACIARLIREALMQEGVSASNIAHRNHSRPIEPFQATSL